MCWPPAPRSISTPAPTRLQCLFTAATPTRTWRSSVTSPAASPSDDEVRALNEKVFHEVLALISAGRHNDMVDLMHEDLVFELPYGPEGMRGPHNKRAFAGMQDYVFSMFTDFSIGVTELHPGLDPNALVVEYASECTVTATGGPYNNRYGA